MTLMMTRPWHEVVARYEDYKGEHRSIRALGTLAQRISQSPLAQGLFASPHMFDLDILQREVSYPYDGPFLRLSAITNDQIEFRYVDTWDKAKQWHRTVDADEAWARLIGFLDQLRWFPAELLAGMNDVTGL
jgi:hypothetical protein